MRSILILNALRIEIHEIKISRERRKTNKHTHAHTHTPTHTLARQWAFVCRLLNAKYLIMLNN